MNVPKLRFKEFDGQFIKYNIEQLVEVTDCKHDTAPVEAEKTIYKMIRTGNVRNGNLLVETMDSVSEDTFHKWSLRGYLEPYDIILTREAPMGEVAIIPRNPKYNFFLGQRCLQLKSNVELADSIYIYFLLQGKRFQKYIRPLKSSGSTVSNIRIPELKSFEFEIPDIKEQIKVGYFLGKINKKIQLQQQKIDLLQEQKKGFLQKMFPKAGETQPEMRFDGFEGDWEHRELEDYFTERSERSSSGELISVTIKLGVIRAADLERRDSSSENKSNYKVVKVGDIAYNSMRMWQGASGYSPYEGILSPAYTVIKPKEDVDTQFFAYMFKRYDMIQTFKKNSQGLTSDTWNLKFPILKRIKVNVPHYDEQRRIAEFCHNRC